MKTQTARELPRVWWGGMEWFMDDTLKEYRSVSDPSIFVTFAEYEAMDDEVDGEPDYTRFYKGA